MSTLARRRAASGRRGVTLVEAMVMLTAVAAMLGTCAAMLGLAMRLQADGIAAFERSQTLDRLSARFRDDVHAARSAAIDAGTLRLTPDAGAVVEYRVADGELARVLVEGGKDAARDPYRLPEGVRLRPNLREIDGIRFAAMVADIRGRRDRIDPDRTLEIVAALGRNLPPNPAEGGRP